MSTRKVLLGGLPLLAIMGATGFLAGAALRPTAVRVTWIRLTERDPWMKTNRLGRLLEFGMRPAEVDSVLGRPDQDDRGSGVWHWGYHSGGCAGMELVLHFRTVMLREEPRLCFIEQARGGATLNPPGTDPVCYTLGAPAPGTSFEPASGRFATPADDAPPFAG